MRSGGASCNASVAEIRRGRGRVLAEYVAELAEVTAGQQMAQLSRLDSGRDDLRQRRGIVECAAREAIAARQREAAIQCLERRLVIAGLPFAFGERGFQ